MTDAQHQELMEVLTTLLKIQSLSAVRDIPTKKGRILFLSEAGLGPKEIAPIVGTTAAAVSQAIYVTKKKGAKDD